MTRRRHRFWYSALWVGVLGSVSARAGAQPFAEGPTPEPLPIPEPRSAPAENSAAESDAPPPLPPPPPPRKRTGTAPSPPAESTPVAPVTLPPPPGVHVHDGFYLRVSLGPHYGQTSVETNRVSQPDVRVNGVGLQLGLWVGGTPKPGIVIGGVLGARSEQSDEGRVGDVEAPVDASVSRVGVFLDAYPTPEEGFHFGGILSAGTSEVESTARGEQPSTSYRGEGVGVSVFAGLDTWIGAEWSFGALVELGGTLSRDEARLDGQDVLRQSTSYFLSAQLGVVYH